MYSVLLILSVCAALISSVSNTLPYDARNLSGLLSEQKPRGPSNDLVVDLGYEQYQGVSNAYTGLNNWFGLVGELSKQA